MATGRTVVVLLLAIGASCQDSTASEPPRVFYRMESETCGGPISFAFAIDGVAVGQLALRDRETSPAFRTAAGVRAVHAQIVNGSFASDTLVTLEAGASYTHILSPYCS